VRTGASGPAAGASAGAAALAIPHAQEVILRSLLPTPSEPVHVSHALGRTLAVDVSSTFDLPPWDNAAMDGYACRAADVRGASDATPVSLPVAETIAAGAFASRSLQPGEVMRIMTGAPIPEGADSVVRVEDTDAGIERVIVRSDRDAHANLRRRGEDVRAGDTVIRSCARVTPAEVAMLAALRCAHVSVHRAPRVALISSGDELVPVDETSRSAGATIVSANSYSLAAVVAEAGGEPVDLGIVRDDLPATVAIFERALDCDLIVTSGGISVGGFDYTRAAVQALGGEIAFWRVAIRPGYNSAFGSVHGTPWLGVPGNPVSALVAGEVLLRPAIRRLCGSTAPLRAPTRVLAGEPIGRGKGVTVFLRGVVTRQDAGLSIATLAGPQGSAILSSSVRANALLIVPPGEEAIAPGSEVDALLLRS
jgi:molybdopterin molybdotransferase